MLPLAQVELGAQADSAVELLGVQTDSLLGAQADEVLGVQTDSTAVVEVMALEGVHQVLVHSALTTVAAVAMKTAVERDMLDDGLMRSEFLCWVVQEKLSVKVSRWLWLLGEVLLLDWKLCVVWMKKGSVGRVLGRSLICKVPGWLHDGRTRGWCRSSHTTSLFRRVWYSCAECCWRVWISGLLKAGRQKPAGVVSVGCQMAKAHYLLPCNEKFN